MNIHEYQAKNLLKKFAVPVPVGQEAFSVDEAVAAIDTIQQAVPDNKIWVVKSQIHAGGRGAGHFKGAPDDKGGVRICQSRDAVRDAATAMLHQTLVTKQTGDEGKQVNRLYIEQGCNIAQELYLSMLIDRASSRLAIVASSEGGMNIEDVAEETPDKILTITIDVASGLQAFHCRKIAFSLGLKGAQVKALTKFLFATYKAFNALDASLLEVNPLVVTADDEVIALDAKMNFDDNALYRHADIASLRDDSEEDAMELEASKHELNYIRLDGDIGCMVNGAGLAMATMDIIQLKGSSPANFLDVGGGATAERVSKAFGIILSDPNVKAILVNIFGGIMRCDTIATGIVEAAKELSIHVPLVVRLEGTNVDKGKEILKSSGLKIISADNLEQAAEKAVAAIA
jgi:succinyl-CoA synthetase beta subunit